MNLLAEKAKKATEQSCAQCAAKKETKAAEKAILVPLHSALDGLPQSFWDADLVGWIIPVCEDCFSLYAIEMDSSSPEERFGVTIKWVTPLISQQN